SGMIVSFPDLIGFRLAETVYVLKPVCPVDWTWSNVCMGPTTSISVARSDTTNATLTTPEVGSENLFSGASATALAGVEQAAALNISARAEINCKGRTRVLLHLCRWSCHLRTPVEQFVQGGEIGRVKCAEVTKETSRGSSWTGRHPPR